MLVKSRKKAGPKKATKSLAGRAKKGKGVDLSNYFGKVKFESDGLTYQKKIRKDD